MMKLSKYRNIFSKIVFRLGLTFILVINLNYLFNLFLHQEDTILTNKTNIITLDYRITNDSSTLETREISSTVIQSESDNQATQWMETIFESDLKLTSHTWLPVDTDAIMFVYSAYYDKDNDNNVPFVRVIGAGLQEGKQKVMCVIQRSASSKYLDTEIAKVEIIPESHNTNHSALFILCKVSHNTKPYAVTIVGTSRTKVRNRLLINYPEPHRFNITVCLPSLHSYYNNEPEIIQSIELDQILGVDHFIVYDFSIGPKVKTVLQHYSSLGILDVRVWNLPNMDIHYYGQMASINDCVYSNRGKSKYVIVKDADEVIVPYKDKTLPKLIERMMDNNTLAATIMFKHTLFDKSWSDELDGFKFASKAKELQLTTLLKVWRETKITKSKQRSKTIYMPNRVITSGIHFVWNVRKGFVNIEVPTNEGLVHHYRIWYGKLSRQKEYFLRQYSKELIERCNKTLSIIHDNVIILNS